MRKWTLLLYFLLLSSATICSAQCNCNPEPEIKKAFNSAAIVFVGRVQKITRATYKQGYNEVVFEILRTFKGQDELLNKEVVIYTPSSESDCGYNFYPSFDYVIYASGKPIFYTTSACERNVILEKAYDELIALKGMK